MVGELKDGEITNMKSIPVGFTMASNRALRVETPERTRAMLMGVP
jgi:anthranilate phosphoribosyltransferase